MSLVNAIGHTIAAVVEVELSLDLRPSKSRNHLARHALEGFYRLICEAGTGRGSFGHLEILGNTDFYLYPGNPVQQMVEQMRYLCPMYGWYTGSEQALE
jgi:hypothetical protein